MKNTFIYMQYFLPKAILSRLMGRLAESKSPVLKTWMIKLFMRKYAIDLQNAVINDPTRYASFNEFFTRQLNAHLRPIDNRTDTIVSPVDGVISQYGQIEKDQLIQAKNFHFDLQGLLGGNDKLAKAFHAGNYATFYLAPHHYHRVHMPIKGSLIETTFIPGKLFSVNQLTSENVAQLYSRNERLICLFETEVGRMALIFVGAMIVGSIQLSWQQQPVRKTQIETNFHNKTLEKGEELGFFKLGSTVILLFEKQKIHWQLGKIGDEVLMGQMIGKYLQDG